MPEKLLRAALREALLKFATPGGLRRLSAPLLRGANWLDQNQLLHSFSRASQPRSPSRFTY